jgi:hypothetical protein
MITDIELSDFIQLLNNLNVSNNNIRTTAERHYEMLKITPESFLPLKLLSVSLSCLEMQRKRHLLCFLFL